METLNIGASPLAVFSPLTIESFMNKQGNNLGEFWVEFNRRYGSFDPQLTLMFEKSKEDVIKKALEAAERHHLPQTMQIIKQIS